MEKGFGRCRCLVSRGPVVQGTLDHKAAEVLRDQGWNVKYKLPS